MDELGFYCILAIKTGHRGFPKKHLVEAVKGERFTAKFMKCDVELEIGTTTFYAGAFMDKIPMLCAGACGLSTLADEVERDRTEWVGGSFRTTRYRVR